MLEANVATDLKQLPEPLTHDQRQLAEQWQYLVPAALKVYAGICRELGQDEARSAIGLAICLAARRFDPARGFKFTTFAFACVRNCLLGELARARRTRGPADGTRTQVLSLDEEPGQFDADLCTSAAIEGEAEAGVEDDEQRSVLAWALGQLPANLARLLRRNVLGGEPLKRLAPALGLSLWKATHLRKKALARLREILTFDPVTGVHTSPRRTCGVIPAPAAPAAQESLP